MHFLVPTYTYYHRGTRYQVLMNTTLDGNVKTVGV